VLAGMRNMNGVLEFIDTADFTVMNSGEHFMCTDIEWDPTGETLRFSFNAILWQK
jgi:translation initiation factor 3 subunit B